MFEYNLFQELSKEDKFTHVLISGLNSLKYEVIEKKIRKKCGYNKSKNNINILN